ncbi:MAG: DegT/DnrJ/EryC1/StrS family aminotransferase [Pirellulales bacterium]
MKQTSRTLERLQLPSDQDSSGRTLGAQELELLEEVILSGTLTSTKGEFVKRFERDFAELVGVDAAWACSSGSAAVHAAVAAIDPEPGDEIVTTAVTDMGALTPILYQGAIPVFADIDPLSYNVTAETIAAALSPRTKAIIVTHLFGNPCEMGPIMELARARGIPVIEDCAQAFGARVGDQPVGAIGDIGCFSLQQGKHITTGEGGIVTTNNADYARRMFLFINKAWGYGDPQPDHYFLALNYRMSELQGAVALAQLSKLGDVVANRVELAAQLTSRLASVAGLGLPVAPAGAVHTYWKYCLDVDPQQIAGGTVALGGVLKEYGVASAPRYIQKPAFRCAIFQEQRTFGQSRFPFTLARPEAVDYDPARFAGTFSALERMLVLPWNERYTSEHVDDLAELIDHATDRLANDTKASA